MGGGRSGLPPWHGMTLIDVDGAGCQVCLRGGEGEGMPRPDYTRRRSGYVAMSTIAFTPLGNSCV